MGGRSPSEIGSEAAAVCAKERSLFRSVYTRNLRKIDKPDVTEALATEDFLAGRHLALTVVRFRL
jgi:hypothetical protein